MAQEPEKVRPRASMPVINGARRVPQRTRSHVARGKKHDELSDALTMKSVEIRGGRIVLDDPSSSESDGEPPETAFRRRVESVGSTASDYIAALGEEEWEEGMRRRWYARRCLGLRQPFDSLHRLAKAEHSSANPFPLLSDLRRVLGETRCELDGRPVDVLLCSESIVVCAASSPDSDEKPQELRAIDFSDELVVRVDDTDETLVHVSDDEQAMVLKFASGGRVWVEQAVQARTRLDILLQDLRLDEEDYVERPPVPLLARGRSSIAGSVANADSVTALGSRFRKRQAQGGVLWVPDHETSVCMVCRKTAFSMMVRRHHCRACGLVICYRCSTVEDKRRLCVRCSGCQTALIPKPSPSLQTLGRRAAEYLPAGDVVMQMAAQRAAAVIDGSCVTRVKPDRHARRPLSTVLFTSADDDNAASNLDCYK
ncbi:hypothetical protein FBU59_003431 [Linderina macrospora]|uniref:Uncharacterized protein n=1 Tax=Linderina macrospora TaxID=4868 RepID=A0ACC1J8I6_9FUNG|nr:hypothetical protein FBU59_003431 [Linderina macrospora]